MSQSMTFILGGARSGKSAYAQQIAEESGQSVLFVATATAGDDEMRQRIANHRASRPQHWHTLEAPLQVGEQIAKAPAADIVLLDCLTLLANNVLFSLPEDPSEAQFQHAMDREIEGILTAWRASTSRWLVISNEVGLGLVPAYPLGRLYRDVLGRANQQVARAADQVLLLVAGLPLKIK
ncbi:MAG: bifunctional adenosylcobinamide kinase/adenosylcobinamide-phosphate guanylyltransferase [Anaerolineae bacterium]|nr:bifunctional adenosylcobinamide kinase/adenosylcobinamide-phosphate guanylyltransferase [Anaerolineae bacterium]